MGLFAWIREFIDGKETAKKVDMAAFRSAAVELCIRELAFQSAVNLMAGALTKCEFRTMWKGKPEKGDEYHLWNVRPNKNQSAAAFRQKLVGQLYRRNEALVIEMDGELYVADDFQVEKFALLEYSFSQVRVDTFTFSRTFRSSDVLYFRLHSDNVNRVLGLLYDSYGKLLNCGMKAYQRNRGVHAVLSISDKAQRDKDFEEVYEKLTGTDLQKFMTADYAVLPQYEGFSYEELGSKTYAAENSRDIKAMVDDIFEFTAKGFSIHPALLKGDVEGTQDAVDNTLTIALDPLAKILEDEINAKRYTRQEYLEGDRVHICTRMVKHLELLDLGSNVEKLVSSGLFSVNGLLELMGEPIIDEPWAWRHFITKNYESIEDALRRLGEKGGESE